VQQADEALVTLTAATVQAVPAPPTFSSSSRYKDGWSPTLLGIKAHMEALLYILERCGIDHP